MSTTLLPDPMTDTDNLDDRLRALELAHREHLGRTDEKWRAQQKQNDECNQEHRTTRALLDSKFSAVFSKLNKLELKTASFATLGALIGGGAVKYLLPG